MSIKKLLIAEQDKVLRDIYQKKFQTEENLELFLAENGQVAIELAKKVQPDLLITCIHMPLIDGFQILQSFSKNTRSYPIVVLTNFEGTDFKLRAGELGADEYFVKREVTMEKLWHVIARHLGFSRVVPWNNDPATLRDVHHVGTWNGCEIYLWKGDITSLTIDVIVNAANTALQGGAGVDGAIHSVGGPTILEECRHKMQGRVELDVGEAVPTGAGNLRAKHVIHVLGPRYYKTEERDPKLLAAAYKNGLACARELGVSSIAFPCISAGFFAYPSDLACGIAADAVKEDLMKNGGLKNFIFCTFSDEDHKIYMEHFGIKDE